MPVNRAGKIVRCPQCKRIIRLEQVSKSETLSGKPIPMTAIDVDDAKNVDADSSVELPTFDETSSGVELPSNIPDFANPENRKIQLRQRVKSSGADRLILLKFFAACLCVVAAVNLAPAVYHWFQWSQNVDSPALPRWIYLQVFIAVIHVIYAVYLVQIPDWSALKVVSIAMLVVAFVFGLVSTGLLTGGGQGTVAHFLELPHVLIYQACMWCVAMLLLSTLLCYMGGREALNWQRTEQLLREIVS